MNLHCFGASTPSGQALRQICPLHFLGYSRNVSASSSLLYPADLADPGSFYPAASNPGPSFWISFAPIWLLAPFLEKLSIEFPERLQCLDGVIACSSSSSITKRFSSNRFDRQLVSRLIEAEDQLLSTCRRLSVPCRILRPTLIYGEAGGIRDGNLSKLLQLMRRLPLLFLPADTGLRQPIHASQLAAVALFLAERLAKSELDTSLPERIAIGGDTTLTYLEMIKALQQSQSPSDPARRCLLLLIPNRLFFLLSSLLMIVSPKAFEAVFRMGANLSGFTPAHQILGCKVKPFPVFPLF